MLCYVPAKLCGIKHTHTSTGCVSLYNSSIVPALFYNKAEIILDATTILTSQERILSSKKSTRLYAAALFRVFFDAKKDEKFERYCVWEKSATKVLFSIGVSLDGTTTGLVCQ